MAHKLFRKITFTNLSSRHKKIYKYHKASSILAEYGLETVQPKEDWEDADFLAKNSEGEICLRVLLKTGLIFHKKYLHKGLYICFPNENDWYLFPHDEVLGMLLSSMEGAIVNSRAWIETGTYSYSYLSRDKKKIIQQYKL